MPNNFYVKGRKKEYKISKQFRELGFEIVQRTAGSHSPLDIIAICRETRQIRLIQSKPDGYNAKKEIEENSWLNGTFDVEFQVI